MTPARINSAALVVGCELPSLTKGPITTKQLVQYAGASGDFNPIHYDDPWAQQAGFPSVIAHGMLSMGFLGQVLSDWAGPAAIKSLAARFRSVAYPGDVITCSGKITTVTPLAHGKEIVVALTAMNQSNTVTVEATATVLLSS